MLAEKRVLNAVTVKPEQGVIEVQWSNQILRDAEVISESYERKAYTAEQKAEFIAEVSAGPQYVGILDW